MIRLIVNADDFGYSRGVNFGIIDAHRRGIVTSATMMMNMPGAEHAIDLAKQNPSLGVGIHLVLTCGRPICPDVPSLVGEDGAFKSLKDVTPNSIVLEEVEREWTAQIEKFLQSGLTPTHLDSHHHVHTVPELLPVVQKLAHQYGDLSVRINGSEPLAGVRPFSDVFCHDFFAEGVQKDYFDKLAEKVKLEDTPSTWEVMVHPAYVDQSVLTGSSYHTKRAEELDILTTVSLPDCFQLVKC